MPPVDTLPHQPIPAKPSPLASDPLLHRLYSLFGTNTVLVPVRNGEFADPRWLDYTVEQSREPANQSILATSDVAVACGPQSQGLTAISFPTEPRRRAFLAQNPVLQTTVLTSFESRYILWLRVEGYKPGDYVPSNFAWMTNSVIVVAERSLASPYRFESEGPVVNIHFNDIQWFIEFRLCEQLRLAEPKALAQLAKCRRIGRARSDDEYYYSVFRNQHGNIHYDPGSKSFYHEEEGSARPLFEEQVKLLLYHTLLGLRDHQVANGNMVGAAKIDTRPRHLARLATMLKIFTARPCSKLAVAAPPRPPKEEVETFAAFIASCLEWSQNDSVTLAEAHAVYAAFCLSRGCASQYSAREFNVHLWQAAKRSFGLAKRHDIMRDGKAKRGLCHLRIKPTTGFNSGKIPDAADPAPCNIKEGETGQAEAA